MTITEMVKAAHEMSRRKGWYDPPHDERNVGEMLMLIVTEVAEAMEDARKLPREALCVPMYGDVPRGNEGASLMKPSGFASEIADVVIRIGDLCGYLGIDLQKAVSEKMAYNATRPYRHGGKIA